MIRRIDNWLDENIIVKLLFINKHTQYIKGALIIIAETKTN